MVSRSDLKGFSNGCSNWACHCLCVHCLSASCLACLCMCSGSFAVSSCFLACIASNTSSSLLDWSLVFLIDSLLTVFLVRSLILQRVMICLSKQHLEGVAWACIVSARASEDIRTYIRAPSTVSRHSGAETKMTRGEMTYNSFARWCTWLVLTSSLPGGRESSKRPVPLKELHILKSTVLHFLARPFSSNFNYLFLGLGLGICEHTI